MDYNTFETEFLLLLKKRDSKCFNLVDQNKRIIELNLGYHSDPKTINKFVEQIGNIVIDIKNKLIKIKNKFELIENVLNLPIFGKVREVFVNSSDVLIRAIKNENKDAANWLITRMNINPKVQDENGMTALMIAAQKNFQSIIKPFLKDSDCLNIEDKYGNNVLFYSVSCKQFIANEAISNNTYPTELINSGIDINHINHDGETALIYCIKKGCFKPIQYLIRNVNLDVNVVDNSGKTAAMYLVDEGNYFDLLSLRRKNCNYDYVNIYNHDSVLSILLNKMYGMGLDGSSVPYKSYIQIFTILVSYQTDFNVDVDTDENTAFMVILCMKDLESATLCAKHLRCLDLSIKNKYGENATSLCFKFGYLDILNIIKDNPTFNYYYRDSVNQNTLLMLSVINKNIFMKELLENDPNVINEVNCKGENALIIATKINEVEAVKTLLNYGININHQDDLGNTALHYAIEIEKPKLVQLIMKKNPKTDLKNAENKTAMMLATEIGNKAVLQVLNDLTGSIRVSDPENNNEAFDKYSTEVQSYIIPFINNNYPFYKCTKEMKKIKDEIYYRFVGTSFKKTMINNLTLI